MRTLDATAAMGVATKPLAANCSRAQRNNASRLEPTRARAGASEGPSSTSAIELTVVSVLLGGVDVTVEVDVCSPAMASAVLFSFMGFPSGRRYTSRDDVEVHRL